MTSARPQLQRFRGPAATGRSLEVAGAATVTLILAASVAGLYAQPIAFFAVGAGAGYSLSGSV